MTIPTITINLDKKCRRCGKPGATDGGLCLKCISKGIKAGEFDPILKPIREELLRIHGKQLPKTSPHGRE